MKRLLAFALAAVMLLSVTACKANREPDVIEEDANLLTQSESKKEDIVIEQSFSSSSEESKTESESDRQPVYLDHRVGWGYQAVIGAVMVGGVLGAVLGGLAVVGFIFAALDKQFLGFRNVVGFAER